jgi:hypothetical protein
MKFIVKVEAEITIEADGIMQADTVWKSLRKEGKPKLLADCSASIAAPHHDYRDRARHRAIVTSRIVSMTKPTPDAQCGKDVEP